jgi:hypothetical protein
LQVLRKQYGCIIYSNAIVAATVCVHAICG